jgi:hypothetical protein
MGDGSLGSTFAELDLDGALDGLDLEGKHPFALLVVICIVP